MKIPIHNAYIFDTWCSLWTDTTDPTWQTRKWQLLTSCGLYVATSFMNSTYAVFSICLMLLSYIWIKRRWTYQKLVDGGLPTVFWRPKFVNYVYPVDDDNHSNLSQNAKLTSTSITGILPRMGRLKGPYGMYGTVYGISTSVFHIAHPVPAVIILSATTTTSTSSHDKSSLKNENYRHQSVSSSSAATKKPAYDHFKNFCGEGVFTADGEDWKAKRAAVLHALLRGSGEPGGYQAKIEQQSNVTATQLIQEFKRYTSTIVDQGTNIVPILQRSTIALIYRYITHTDLPTMDSPCSTIIKSKTEEGRQDAMSTKDVIHSLIPSYLISITRIRMIILAQSRSVWFILPRWMYRTMSDLYRQEEKTMTPIRELAHQACLNARTQPSSPLALLQHYNSTIYNSTKIGFNKSKNLFSKSLIDEAITLLFAGQDTSAATLSWTLHLLSLYPNIQEKLAHEVRSIISTSTDGSVYVSKTLVSKMTYLDAVIKESMRLYPVAPFIVRKLPTTIQLPNPINKHNDSDNDTSVQSRVKRHPYITLHAGTLACIWIYSLHRNPEFWNRPDDFIPERWLSEAKTTNKNVDAGIKTVGAYIPFAFGPRNCVGQPLAQTILRTILSRLIYQFRFKDPRLKDGSDPKALLKDMQAGFTVLPLDGVYLTIHDRHGE